MAGGASLDISVAPIERRGMRKPRHVNYIKDHGPQTLYPFIGQPLRPGETLSNVSVVGDSYIRSIVNLQQAPLTWAEMGVWVIPISSLAPFFLDIIVGSGEDSAERTFAVTNVGTGAPTARNPLSGQGHATPGLQGKSRVWAGEHGGESAGNLVAGSQYAPYISHAMYKIATDWYDLAITGQVWSNPLLMDQAPFVERFVQGSLVSNFDSGLVGVDSNPSSSSSLADMLESIFLLTTGEFTYAEYLAAHGVDPRRVDGMARPIMLRQALLQGPGDKGDVAVGVGDGTVNVADELEDQTQQADLLNSGAGTQQAMYFDRASYGQLGHDWRESWNGNLFIEEPSILLGSMCWYPVTASNSQYGEHFDMTRMTHPGHWGNVMGGGVDEEDFLATQLIYNSENNLQVGASPDQSGDAIFNMMNLYLNGDTTAIGNEATEEFRYREIGGAEWANDNGALSSRLSTQLGIRSDLVS